MPGLIAFYDLQPGNGAGPILRVPEPIQDDSSVGYNTQIVRTHETTPKTCYVTKPQ